MQINQKKTQWLYKESTPYTLRKKKSITLKTITLSDWRSIKLKSNPITPVRYQLPPLMSGRSLSRNYFLSNQHVLDKIYHK
ncbi:hypothetical protein pb186bvf_018549 [Paramecium bursaria]